MGRRPTGHLVLPFPKQFTNDYRSNQIGLGVDFFKESDVDFKKAQIWNWVLQNVGMNLSAHRSFLKHVRKELLFHLYDTCCSSSLRMVVDAIEEISTINFDDETFQLLVHLKLFLIHTEKTIQYELTEHQLLINFLFEPDILDNLTDPKLNCNDQDLMVSSSHGCGYFIGKSYSVIDFYKSLLREGNRLGFDYRGCGRSDSSLDYHENELKQSSSSTSKIER